MKKFFKKPLNIASVALMVVGIVVMVALLIIPHGGTYTHKSEGEVLGVKYEYTQVLKLKGDKVYSSVKSESESLSEKEMELGTYKIDSGELVMNGVKTGMSINAFKITSKNSDESFTCKLNVTIMIVACAMAVVGLAGTVYGALTLKKKKK